MSTTLGPVDDLLHDAHEADAASTRAAVARYLRAHPEAVLEARLAVWVERGPGEDYLLVSLASEHWSERLGEVWGEGGRWWWGAYGPSPARRGDETTPEAAREACARALPGWVVPEAPAPPAPEAETAAGDTRGEAPQTCEACRGLGEVGAPSSRYGAASRCNGCGGTGRAT